ncbi:TraX family protein [Pseudomonas helleri]|uniref:TraX family protein n=1 Tax=Pseudomonas helleri TaxID=1608996 RepID=UPI003FD419EB
MIKIFTESRPRLEIPSGSIELLKWLALVLMTGDHINKYLLNSSDMWLYNAGRLAMPLFMFVLAYNLSRPDSLRRGIYRRTMLRLLIFGILASPAFLALNTLVDGWWPLNILFTLFALTITLRLIEEKKIYGYCLAVISFFLGGLLVEFWWPAILFGLASWIYIKQNSLTTFIFLSITCLLLGYVNNNQWAVAAIPIIHLFKYIHLTCPRSRLFFYIFYPAHLIIIYFIRVKLIAAGYLFFT